MQSHDHIRLCFAYLRVKADTPGRGRRFLATAMRRVTSSTAASNRLRVNRRADHRPCASPVQRTPAEGGAVTVQRVHDGVEIRNGRYEGNVTQNVGG
jgi:hypothetical protein